MSTAKLLGISKRDAYQIAELGYQFLKQGKTKEALAIFEGLAVLNPKDPYFQFVLCGLWKTLKNFPQALVHISSAIDLKPTDISYLLKRSEIYIQMSQITQALMDLKKILGMDPSHPQALAMQQQYEHLAMAASTQP